MQGGKITRFRLYTSISYLLCYIPSSGLSTAKFCLGTLSVELASFQFDSTHFCSDMSQLTKLSSLMYSHAIQ